jgi:hypothetical protein
LTLSDRLDVPHSYNEICMKLDVVRKNETAVSKLGSATSDAVPGTFLPNI